VHTSCAATTQWYEIGLNLTAKSDGSVVSCELELPETPRDGTTTGAIFDVLRAAGHGLQALLERFLPGQKARAAPLVLVSCCRSSQIDEIHENHLHDVAALIVRLTAHDDGATVRPRMGGLDGHDFVLKLQHTARAYGPRPADRWKRSTNGLGNPSDNARTRCPCRQTT
jgi:hypothetical protein